MVAYTMLRVAGIDQSANHTGVCVLGVSDQPLLLQLIEPGRLREEARLAFIRDGLRAALAPWVPTVLVMEGYSHGSVNRKFLLGEIGSIVKLMAHDLGAKLYVAAPTQLKQFVTGRGGATKGDMIDTANSQWNLNVEDDNLADAYGLARIAREIQHPQSTCRRQIAVVHKLTSPPKKRKKRKKKEILFPGAV